MPDRSFSHLAVVETNPAALTALMTAIRRALDVVEAETLALRDNASADLKVFEHRKSQVLLDLERARQAVPAYALTEDIKELLERLRLALQDNMTLLFRHLSAVKEISDLVAQSMLDAESDGTYARPLSETQHD